MPLTLSSIKRKINKLAKEYESLPESAVLSKRRVERKIRRWINLEQKAKEMLNENNNAIQNSK